MPGRRRRCRRRRYHPVQRGGQHGGRGDRGVAVGLALEEDPAGDVVDAGGDAGPDLAGAARVPVNLGGGRQRRPLAAWPVCGQRGVQQFPQAERVGQGRIVSGDARQGRVDAQANDLHAAAGRPAQRVGVEAQVGDARGVRDGERLGALGYDLRALAGVERPVGQQIFQGVPGHPLHDDVGVVPVLFHVEDLRQPGVGEPACRPGRGHRVGDAREPAGEREHGDGPGERFVDRLPGCPPTTGADPVFEPVSPAEAGARFRDEGAHGYAVKSGAGPRPSFRAPGVTSKAGVTTRPPPS